ncbi:mediator of RNA polymerase II transcription subunit 29 [Athene cunicularia]|uniref:mediator of RNA polymerase II transcription subunit 29 n=1 Tax=Athene cunicularia TaxID=194338 RepID=UPI000EF7204D|nr:mediator of RNA polymerase II transcription subunit 29 [Athene cunicularia]
MSREDTGTGPACTPDSPPPAGPDESGGTEPGAQLQHGLQARLAHECLSQSFDSAKRAPALVMAAPKGEGGADETLPYTQYLPLIKAQMAGAKNIHNALLEGANKITGKLPPRGSPECSGGPHGGLGLPPKPPAVVWG